MNSTREIRPVKLWVLQLLFARSEGRPDPTPGIFDDPIGGKVGSSKPAPKLPQNTLKKNTTYALISGALGLVFWHTRGSELDLTCLVYEIHTLTQLRRNKSWLQNHQ